MRLARFLGALGRSMITAGVLILLFVAYQLWGTGILQAQAQDRLERQFADELATTTTTTTTPTTAPASPQSTTPASTVPPLSTPVPTGDAIGKITISRIGLKDQFLVEGVGDDDLKKGPGHYPDTPLPGQKGNAAIAGHRTTYGAPFASIDELQVGDQIVVQTLQGTFHYQVMAQADGKPYQIVTPSHVEVLDDAGDNRLTLTACHPKYSASERIVVSAALVGDPVPTPPTTPRETPVVAAGLGGKRAPIMPAVLLALLCAAIWIAAWLLGRWWRKWPAYAVGLPFFLVALFFFFENFSRLLPSNY